MRFWRTKQGLMWFPLRKNSQNFIHHKGKQISYDAKNEKSDKSVALELIRNNF